MAQNNIPVSELYWSLVDKADRKFSRVMDLPNYGRNRNDSDFPKAFSIYTKLWKLQQENRQRLVEAGIKRWEIGEIASRIAQLYYGQYQRSGESSYLSESYIFYEAILTREYFKDGSSQDRALCKKQLRFLARFLMVCIVLSRREMAVQLANQLRALVDESKRNFQESEFKEWKQLVQGVVRFLKVDTPFMNMRPLRYSFVFDSHPDSLPSVASCEVKRGLVLRDAILSSYHHNEVKFMELTLDSFRMLQCLEWEPCGFFSIKSGTDIGNDGTGLNSINPLQDIRDPTLPPNPHKVILYRPSTTHFLMVLATICEELPPDGILLIYLSATGEGGQTLPVPLAVGDSPSASDNITESFNSLGMASPTRSPPDTPTQSSFENKENHKSNREDRLCLGSHGSGGLNYLYPCDLIPFTRRPIFLVIDSNISHAFKPIHGAEKGETIAMLLSPRSQPPAVTAATDSARHQNGSQFTMFLTAPMQAFCCLLDISGMNIDKDACNKAEKLLSLSLSDWEMALVTSSSLHPIWVEVLGDPFLRRLLLRFIFCRAVLALYIPTFHQEEFLPACLPCLPESVSPENPTSQSAIMRLANFFNATESFAFSEGISPHEPDTEESMIIKPSDIHEIHFSAANGC